MQTISLTDGQVEAMREFYLEEYQKALVRLDHLKDILKKLGESDPEAVKTASVPRTMKKKRKSKPGRKSVWEPLILKRLRQLDKPVTYEELTEEIMTLAKIPPEKKKSTKQSILSVAFRMRSRDHKIDTYSAGVREKYIGLRQWFDEPGKLNKEYSKKIEVPGKPARKKSRRKSVKGKGQTVKSKTAAV